MAAARARAFLEMIKFEHTIFALPFAYLGMVLAASGWPDFPTFFWITVAMASARTLAMAGNRLVDRHLDARNPRTANRPLVSGQIQPSTAWIGLVLSGIVLVLAAYRLGPLPFRLLPGALVFLLGYPFTKRFTILSHLVLGFTDGLAPMGAWAAVRGSLFTTSDLPAWILLLTVTSWIAGFDLLYATQDAEFDRSEGLHAVPARYGVHAALRLSAAVHAVTALLLISLGLTMSLGWPYWLGVLLTVVLLAYQHLLVRPDDLSRLDLAFFNINGAISLTLFFATLGALLLQPQ